MDLKTLKTNKQQKKKKSRKSKIVLLAMGFAFGVAVVAALYQTSVYFSTNDSCAICHVHPHAHESWELSSHVNNKSGVMTNCVDCHLPPITDTWSHYTAKIELGVRDVWGYLTKDTADINWEMKSELEIGRASCRERV